jgi:hypothetical protein
MPYTMLNCGQTSPLPSTIIYSRQYCRQLSHTLSNMRNVMRFHSRCLYFTTELTILLAPKTHDSICQWSWQRSSALRAYRSSQSTNSQVGYALHRGNPTSFNESCFSIQTHSLLIRTMSRPTTTTCHRNTKRKNSKLICPKCGWAELYAENGGIKRAFPLLSSKSPMITWSGIIGFPPIVNSPNRHFNFVISPTPTIFRDSSLCSQRSLSHRVWY